MKKTLILSSILICISFSIKSQSGFRPGFIIKDSGDTLNGLIFYGSNRNFEKSCRFKRFEIAREVSYSADQVRAFGFRNGRFFESLVLDHKRVFFECMVKGDVSVFINPGKYTGTVYLQSEQTGLFKLAKGSNKLEGVGNFNNYREALKWILTETGSKEVILNDLKYDAKEIAAAVRESSSGENAPVGFYQTPGIKYLQDNSVFKEGSLLSAGFSGGYQFVSVTASANEYARPLSVVQYNTSYRPALGLYINRKLSRKSELFSIDLGMHYIEDSYYGNSDYTEGIEIFQEDIMIEFSEIQVPLSLHFTFGKGSIRPFAKAGIYKSFIINQSFSRISDRRHGQTIYTEYSSDFTLDKNDGGLNLGAGVQFSLGKARMFSLECAYSKSSRDLTKPNSLQIATLHTSVISIMARINL